MTYHIYHDDEFEISGDACAISGDAYYEYEISNGLNADIGGVDGVEVVGAQLILVSLDGVALHREHIAKIMGEADLSLVEDRVADHLSDMLSQGDDIDDLLPQNLMAAE